MWKGGGMSFWHKCILHPNKPLCDAPNMIIMKSCGVCGQSYHCFDIAMTSCLHTYHSYRLGQHLKTHNKCKVCNQRLHLDRWSSWGFKDLDEDLTFAPQEMGVEKEWVHLLNELKQIARQSVHGVLGEYLILCLHQNFHLGITIIVGLFMVYVLQVF
jgi:hypothetical protein